MERHSLYVICHDILGVVSISDMYNDAYALKTFGRFCSSQSHPEDYSLYRVGDFDMTHGQISAVSPVLLSRGSDFVKEDDHT